MSDNNLETTTEVDSQGLYDPDLFKDDLSLIDNEIQAIDDLYNEVKTHYNAVKNSPSRGSLSFVEKQTTNLVNLKTAKLNYIKQRIDAKKALSDFKYKDTQIDLKKNNGETAAGAFNEALYNKIMESFSFDAKKVNQVTTNLNKRPDNDDIDSELDESLDEEDLKEIRSIIGNSSVEVVDEDEVNNESVVIDDKPDDEIYAYDKESGEFYILNDDYEITFELGKDYDTVTEFYEEDEQEYAVGENDITYLCIDVE